MLISSAQTIATPERSPELGRPAMGKGQTATSYIVLRSRSGAEGRAPIRKDLAGIAKAAAQALLVGADARATAAHWKALHAAASPDRYTSLPVAVIAALDLALWDLRATEHDVPLFREIGGENTGTPVLLSLPQPKGPGSAGKSASALTRYSASDGGFMFAIPATEDLATDIPILRAIQSAAASNPAMAVGVTLSGELSPKAAVNHIAQLERVADIAFVEAPTTPWNTEGFLQVSAGVRAAVCNAPNVASPGDLYPFLRRRALDIVQINPHLVGITGALEISDAAYAFELPVIIAPTVQGFAAHLAGALPYAMCVRLPQDAGDLVNGARISNGRITAGDTPGAGWRPMPVEHPATGAAS